MRLQCEILKYEKIAVHPDDYTRFFYLETRNLRNDEQSDFFFISLPFRDAYIERHDVL